jgi:hypothetical protein
VTEAEKIRKAAYRILEPGAWTRRAPARDARGDRTDTTSPDACQWCAAGALALEGSNPWLVGGWVTEVGITGITVLNDLPGTKAEDMATLLLLAAEIVESES